MNLCLREREMNSRTDSENQTSQQIATGETRDVPVVASPNSVLAPAEPIDQSRPIPRTATETAPAPAPHITIINQQGGAGGNPALSNPALLAASGALVDKSPGVALVLSLFITGAGQLYNGQIGKGILMFVSVVVCASLAVLVIPAIIWLIIWLWSAIDAYRVAKQKHAIYVAAMMSMQTGQQGGQQIANANP